jgi:hypothetical protein
MKIHLCSYFSTDLTGLEPATSAVTGRCSNRLNYKSNNLVKDIFLTKLKKFLMKNPFLILFVRRKRDSNPRHRKLCNRLAIYRIRPLCHPSITIFLEKPSFMRKLKPLQRYCFVSKTKS